MLSPDARNTAWVSFDGRKRQEICHGDRSSLFLIVTSLYKYRKYQSMHFSFSNILSEGFLEVKKPAFMNPDTSYSTDCARSI